MHHQRPQGVLPGGLEELAHLMGVQFGMSGHWAEDVLPLIRELDEAAVFSRGSTVPGSLDANAIVNRRMYRKWLKSEIRRQAANVRWWGANRTSSTPVAVRRSTNNDNAKVMQKLCKKPMQKLCKKSMQTGMQKKDENTSITTESTSTYVEGVSEGVDAKHMQSRDAKGMQSRDAKGMPSLTNSYIEPYRSGYSGYIGENSAGAREAQPPLPDLHTTPNREPLDGPVPMAPILKQSLDKLAATVEAQTRDLDDAGGTLAGLTGNKSFAGDGWARRLKTIQGDVWGREQLGELIERLHKDTNPTLAAGRGSDFIAKPSHFAAHELKRIRVEVERRKGAQ
jgi:hypothetical protein